MPWLVKWRAIPRENVAILIFACLEAKRSERSQGGITKRMMVAQRRCTRRDPATTRNWRARCIWKHQWKDGS